MKLKMPALPKFLNTPAGRLFLYSFGATLLLRWVIVNVPSVAPLF